MSETKFTPGPWYLCERGDYDDFGGNSRVILSEPPNGDNPYRLAAVHTGSLYDEPGDANALLMAAAPDLYEALAAIVDHETNKRDFFTWGKKVDAATAALKKARGET